MPRNPQGLGHSTVLTLTTSECERGVFNELPLSCSTQKIPLVCVQWTKLLGLMPTPHLSISSRQIKEGGDGLISSAKAIKSKLSIVLLYLPPLTFLPQHLWETALPGLSQRLTTTASCLKAGPCLWFPHARINTGFSSLFKQLLANHPWRQIHIPFICVTTQKTWK